MRTKFTLEDVKDIVSQIYNNDDNSEEISIKNEDGEETISDLATYLNIKFYTWKHRLVEKQDMDDSFGAWLNSLNISMKESYALVEKVDEEVVASQDIDSGTIQGRITFLVQTDKLVNLEYYNTKIRNTYLGVPQKIQNSFGNIINAYILIGTLSYDEEPIVTQLGETSIVSLNFIINYMADAQTYTDVEVGISFNSDNTYDENGEVVGDDKYLTMPLTKITWQEIMPNNAVTRADRPDLTGFVATAITSVKTLTFYDFNKELTNTINNLFWSLSAVRIDGVETTTRDVNIPVFIRIKNDGHTYIYQDVLDNIEKVLTNSDFTISSITLKGWGKKK